MRMMPIMLGHRAEERINEAKGAGCAVVVVQIPWPMIEAHEVQAKTNHGQTLARLADRGGLSACEALAIIEDRLWQRMPPGEANARLAEMLAASN
jgi:hypothetical protein